MVRWLLIIAAVIAVAAFLGWFAAVLVVIFWLVVWLRLAGLGNVAHGVLRTRRGPPMRRALGGRNGTIGSVIAPSLTRSVRSRPSLPIT